MSLVFQENTVEMKKDVQYISMEKRSMKPYLVEFKKDLRKRERLKSEELYIEEFDW